MLIGMPQVATTAFITSRSWIKLVLCDYSDSATDKLISVSQDVKRRAPQIFTAEGSVAVHKWRRTDLKGK